MKLVIAGSRDFFDRSLVDCHMLQWIETYWKPTLIISGGAVGADSLGIDWAKDNGIPYDKMRPEYKKYPPKVAPIMRNKRMAAVGDGLLLFWNGVSRGSANMLDEMKKLGKPVLVIIKLKNEEVLEHGTLKNFFVDSN